MSTAYIYIDGRKDANQKFAKINRKYHQNVQPEEHNAVVDERGEFYLPHATPTGSTGLCFANSVVQEIVGTELESKLAHIGSDGTAVVTGSINNYSSTRNPTWTIVAMGCKFVALQ